ncbi:MAG: large subunit ribosomal protein [Candidatus Methanomethylophilaceae archaeon]|nr:large subunit ribosomal protein [Candidatus Methanomethylophilaceae archaeon]MDI3541671.1 large subunit ribosomal protein [Candidatus Methanomethylophilaceae archaeon]
MPSRTRKLRGSRTHGRGKKAGRGAGLIGGHGNAGRFKHEKLRVLKYDRDHFGRRGFKRPQETVKADITINVGELQESLPQFLEKGLAHWEGDRLTVDLSKAGIDKLLGEGHVNIPIDVTVAKTSAMARDKIEARGGSVIEE